MVTVGRLRPLSLSGLLLLLVISGHGFVANTSGGCRLRQQPHEPEPVPETFLHVHGVSITNSGSKSHPWRRLHATRRFLEEYDDLDAVPSSAGSPPFGESIHLSFFTHGNVNATFSNIELKHHTNLFHKDAMIEFHTKAGKEPQQIKVPNNV